MMNRTSLLAGPSVLVPVTARTWKLYPVPLVRPVTVWLVVVVSLLGMLVRLLLDGSLQFKVTWALPAVAVRPVGADRSSSSVMVICMFRRRSPDAPPSRPVAV